MRATAAIDGRAVATTGDLSVLIDALWNKPEERAAVKGQVQEVINPVVGDALKVLDAASEAFDALDLTDVTPAGVANLSTVNGTLKDMVTTVRDMSDEQDVQDIAAQIETLQGRVFAAAAAAFK